MDEQGLNAFVRRSKFLLITFAILQLLIYGFYTSLGVLVLNPNARGYPGPLGALGNAIGTFL
jgi:hypothetical protein